MFIAVNTSALNVERVLVPTRTYPCTDEFILERNYLNVVFVANDSQRLEILLCTVDFIVERNHLNVVFVANDSQKLDILLDTAEFTVERNRTNVACVTWRLVSLHI